MKNVGKGQENSKMSMEEKNEYRYEYKGHTDDFILTNDNYYSPEAQEHYISIHTYLDIMGSLGRNGCEARGMATLNGLYKQEDTTALLVGSYVDSCFEGTLDKFRNEHREIFTQKGELRSEYKRAEKMIARAEQDEYFMRFMKGKKQVVMTGYFAGLWWKIKIDNLMINKDGEPIAIVDLKTTGKPLNQMWNVRDYGAVSFVEYWGYDFQMALYQEIARIITGKRLPTYIAVITKEEEPDIAIIGLQEASGGNMLLDNALNTIKNNAESFKSILTGEIEPTRCERPDCMYCRRTKRLTEPIFYQDLITM